MKRCSKCEEEKPLEEFHKHKRSKDGRRSSCKECQKQWRENNKEKRREYNKQYREKNREKILEQKKQYYDNNKEKILEQQKQYYDNNKEKIIEQKKQYHENNREKIREYNKQYFKNNKEKIIEYQKRYRENNREKMNQYRRQRYKNDPKYRLRHNISRAFREFLKGRKEKSTSEHLKDCGYSRKELMKHLEGQFDQNMTWNNYGSYWHVDHIIPQSVFEPTNEQHLKWCWSLENLRPLESSENASKNNRIIPEEIKKISFYENVKHLLKD